MKKSKLVLLFKSLEEEEMNRLEEFLTSPYYNKDPEVMGLFECLRAFYPDFSSSALTKGRIHKKLFSKQPYEDKRLRYLMSKLNKLAEHFLALQEVEQKPYLLELSLVEDLSRRGLQKSYQQAGRSLSKKLEKRKGDSVDFFLAQFQWAEVREHHFERQRLRRYDESIQIASAQLDRYYFLNRLRISCAMLDRQTIFQASYELNLSSDWIRHLGEQDFFGEPIIRLYYTIYRALSDESEEAYFKKIKQGLAQESKHIPFRDLRDIYLFAINYCARKIRQGREAYVEEALQLYRRGIESHILIEEGILSPWAFTNVVKLSLRMKQYDYIEGFIEKYARLLPEAFRDNALHYNLAELFYYTGRYDEAQEQLNQVAYSDLNYYLGARVMLAKIYYETDAEEPLLALIASFTIFLKRNKQLSNDLKHTYLNFCQLLFQIIRRKPSRLKHIHNRIQSTELLTDRSWLKDICEAVMHQSNESVSP